MPSLEQQAIVDSVVRDQSHVKVEAVAGAGKTTTILHVAAALGHLQQLLVLTYNAKLKGETRQRCADTALTNVAVHTYHSAAYNMYDDKSCSRDEGIASLVSDASRLPTHRHRRAYAVIVVDEAQDMTHLYFALVRKLMRDVCVPDVRVVVLGDARQSVYGFKGSDARFLTLAPRLPAFASPTRGWREHTLTTTYRLAPTIATFVNSQLLEGVQLLRSSNDSPGSVRYLRCNTFGDLPFRQVNAWLAAGLSGSDIFVLAPSIRVNNRLSPLRILENRLVRADIKCYAASSDDERLDEDVTRGKIVFATFHQVKGLERRAVLVFNFDDSYHRFYERGVGDGCPNAIYVAVTRAIQHLTVLHDSKQGTVRTVREERVVQDGGEFVTDSSRVVSAKARAKAMSAAVIKAADDTNSREIERAVTDLLRHQKEEVLQTAMACLTVRSWPSSSSSSSSSSSLPSSSALTTLLKSKIDTGDDSWENVAAITGTAMPCIYEYESSRWCTLLARAAAKAKGLPIADRQRVLRLYEHMLTSSPSVPDFLYIANVHIALTGGFTHRLRQIKEYDWVREEDVASMLAIMRRHVTGPVGTVEYERPASLVIPLVDAVTGIRRMVKLSCAVDCMDTSTKTAFEIKCVSVVSAEHLLQTALNALLLDEDGGRGYRHVLLNLCDGGAQEIVLDRDRAMQAARVLLEAKFAAERNDDDATFLQSLLTLRYAPMPIPMPEGKSKSGTGTFGGDETGPDTDDVYGFVEDV